jgi:DNA-binding IscR family transcriptional regulator
MVLCSFDQVFFALREKSHLMECFKRTQAKPLKYSQLAQIKQEMEEAPSAFLERLRVVLIKHTKLNPDIDEGQLILKDKFITQSTPRHI